MTGPDTGLAPAAKPSTGDSASAFDVLTSPAVLLPASIAWMVAISVTGTQLAALLITGSAPYPIAYAFYDVSVTCVLISPFFWVWPAWVRPPTWSMRYDYALTCAAVVFDIAFTEIALGKISTALEQSLKSMRPVVTVLIETLVMRRLEHPLVYACVVLVSAGAALASWGEISTSPSGFAAAVIALAASACKYIFWRRLLTHEGGAPMHPLGAVFWTDLVTVPIYLVWAAVWDDLEGYIVALGHAATFWQATGTTVSGFLQALSEALVLVLVPATDFSAYALLATVINICLSLFVTQVGFAVMRPTLLVGIALVVVVLALFAWIRSDARALPAIDRATGCARGTTRDGGEPGGGITGGAGRDATANKAAEAPSEQTPLQSSSRTSV